MKTAAVEISNQEQRYLTTIRNLRSKNFSRNLPFLILSNNLPDGQVYREFPDGRIELQEVQTSGLKYQSKTIQVLKAKEADEVRKEHGLF